ncbi:hypothetical protein BT93_B2512 [Corymbia citriodora subsp. variegata]|nr:hypothetical protein BT93_B2512 [Corymbia citriodora subsp. variegata]
MDISHVTYPSSSVSRRPEVFLSFRGVDMRRGFTDFLYAMLADVGISVFRDEEELERGREIDPQLIQAIEQSNISIPVISKEYVSSESSLMELEQMLQCMEKKNRIIIPIFYYVNPSDVRNCSGPFERASDSDEHQKTNWMSALRRIGELEGHHLHEKSEVSPGEIVKQIVCQVQQMLKKEDLILPKQLVGVDSHVQGVMAKLKVGYHNGQAIKITDTCEKVLIYGIPGVGKTVLAKCVYNKLHHLFDACSFLGQIQAKIKCHSDILSLQNKLICDLDEGNAGMFDSSEKALLHIRKNFCTMKVLLLLDDVYNHEQLSALVGELDWLGPGSRVILTSQTQEVLRNINGAESIVLEPMKQEEALKLFCRHAFGMDSPREEFEKLSTDIVAATGRLPLALELTGSSLFLVKSKKLWRETLAALEVSSPHEDSSREEFEKLSTDSVVAAGRLPLKSKVTGSSLFLVKPKKARRKTLFTLDHERVQAKLKASYDAPEDSRQISPDRVSYFIGEDERIPHHTWDDRKNSPSSTMPALPAKSFVKIGEDDKLFIHETLKKFGWEIVKNENGDPKEPRYLLKRREGTEKVEALRLESGDGPKGNIGFERDQFVRLQNLELPKLDRGKFLADVGGLLPSLRWLSWRRSSEISDVPLPNLSLQNLVVLDLSGSLVDKDWRGWKLLVGASKLKVLNLTRCVQLTATPTFPPSMKLERLILERCSNLTVIHPSLKNLKQLVYLNINGCILLCKLPDLGPMRNLEALLIDGTSISRISFRKDSMMNLQILSARNCKNLIEISDSIGYLESLVCLALDGSEIHTLPVSVGLLEKLSSLSLNDCRRLSNLPDGIGDLSSLQFLDLCHTATQELPTSVKDLKAMKVLRMRGTLIREFPKVILNLEKLEEIDFSLCPILEGRIPDDIWRLSSLAILKLTCTRISGLPPSFHRLSRLQELDISGCDNLQSLPDLPSSLINVLRDLGD